MSSFWQPSLRSITGVCFPFNFFFDFFSILLCSELGWRMSLPLLHGFLRDMTGFPFFIFPFCSRQWVLRQTLANGRVLLPFSIYLFHFPPLFVWLSTDFVCLRVRYGGTSHMKLPFSSVCVDVGPGASDTAVFLLNTPPSPSAPSQRYETLFAFRYSKEGMFTLARQRCWRRAYEGCCFSRRDSELTVGKGVSSRLRMDA